MMDIQVFPIPALSDNYIWCIHNNEQCWVVDPGQAEPVIEALKQKKLNLSGILVTHHHWDHTNGIDALVAHFPDIPVIGPDYGNIGQLTQRVKQDQKVVLTDLNIEFDVLYVPGHTLDHIAFYANSMLFCGDTLFSVGCGRLFEGTADQMWASLQKLMQLPAETAVYCTHEYTLANIQFAKQVEPENTALKQYSDWAEEQRKNDRVTLPTTIEQQKAINPFLRATINQIKINMEHHVGKTLPDSNAVFAAIRQWKDTF